MNHGYISTILVVSTLHYSVSGVHSCGDRHSLQDTESCVAKPTTAHQSYRLVSSLKILCSNTDATWDVSFALVSLLRAHILNQ